MTEKKSFPKVNYKSVLLFFDNQVLEELKLKHLDLLQNPKTTAFNEIEVFKYDDYCTNFRSSLILLLSGKGVSKQELLRVKFNEIMLYLIQREPLKMGPC